ncbi:hypothetical protein [Pedobacter miscanthi]|uniref:hypothetical protein n=1 Tax=Pedobacter miscanthi TaxID=2259170 RepID=UPI0029319D3B|nr:hypothetical protein [Pedobacter miscanthi]
MANLKNYDKKIILAVLLCFIFGSAALNSCKKDSTTSEDIPTVDFSTRLSAYNIYQGTLSDLVPRMEYHPVSLATTLYTDYAEKQRLISLPAGTQMISSGDGLPSFPDGTIMVKTFYYYTDLRDLTRGKRILETRLLIKRLDRWNLATYVWNDAQSEAFLQEGGSVTNVSWITVGGSAMAVNYRIPSAAECNACHNSNGTVIPIGPKLSNLSVTLSNNGQNENQLAFFQSQGILNRFAVDQVAPLPGAFDSRFTLVERARAYIDVNCAHCHNPNGIAGLTNLHMSFNLPLDRTGISERKTRILERVTAGEMPLLGKTVVHQEGLQLIRDYIATLP